MDREKPILITGSHRSGSTWLGKMITLSPTVAYIHEPFNKSYKPGICAVKFDYWFTYISKQNEYKYYEPVKNTINFKYNSYASLKNIKSNKDILRFLQEYYNFFLYRVANNRPLIKDPIALFSCEWLASRFDMDVIITIRHPAAFAGSLKIKNWTFPFSDLLNQSLLMKNLLYPYAYEIEKYSREKKDIVDQAILFWNLTHTVIKNYTNDHPEWIFIRHEDLSRNPLIEFKNIYDKLNIRFSKNIEKKLKSYTNESLNSGKSNFRANQIKRNSKSNIRAWEERLTKSEIFRIRKGTERIACHFYSDKDW